MVTKQRLVKSFFYFCSVLAKIHMVTKQGHRSVLQSLCSVLAKIHMVTKPQKHTNIFLNLFEVFTTAQKNELVLDKYLSFFECNSVLNILLSCILPPVESIVEKNSDYIHYKTVLY